MKKGLVVTVLAVALVLVLVLVLLVALPGTASADNYFESPFPMVQAHFLGDYWDPPSGNRVNSQVDASVIGSQWNQGFPVQPMVHGQSQVQGLITVRYWVPLSDGTTAEKSFTVRPKYHSSIDSFPGLLDAGAAASVAGYVIRSSGEGTPAVGDFYVFFFWDGAHGLTQYDGSITYYRDAWYLTKAEDTPIWLRNFQRNLALFYDRKGVSQLRLSEGDINISNAFDFSGSE